MILKYSLSPAILRNVCGRVIALCGSIVEVKGRKYRCEKKSIL